MQLTLEAEIAEPLASLAGTPASMLADPFMRELLVPIMRANFEAYERYLCDTRTMRDTPLIFLGDDDDNTVPVDSLMQWQVGMMAEIVVCVFEDGHFFYFDQSTAVVVDAALRAGAQDNAERKDQ